MIETIKLVGGIAGLATAAFTIWDRMVRGRPLAYIVANGEYGEPYLYLRVKNIGTVGILITHFEAKGARLSKDHSLDAIVRSAVGETPTALLEPGQEHDFVFLKAGTQDAEGLIWFRIHWRRTSSTWMPLPPKVVSTTSADVNRLSDASKKSKE